MSNLKNKSEINSAAAILLQKQCFYPSVIHCAYYSCVQYMKHLLLTKLGKTELELANEVRNSSNGSHEVMINNILEHLKNKNKDWKTFLTTISQLKKLRVSADYENIQIDSTKGSNSILLSEAVLKHLKANI